MDRWKLRKLFFIQELRASFENLYIITYFAVVLYSHLKTSLGQFKLVFSKGVGGGGGGIKGVPVFFVSKIDLLSGSSFQTFNPIPYIKDISMVELNFI